MKWHPFQLTMAEARSGFRDMDGEAAQHLVDDAIDATRS